jgi:hypothetical protein
MNAIRDDFNPKFVTFSPIRPGESSADFVAHIDEAIRSYCTDPFEFGGEIVLEQLGDVTAPGTMRIDLWVEDLGDATCTYGFLCSSANGSAAYARGERTVRKLGAPWSEAFRRTNTGLLRDLHAFA